MTLRALKFRARKGDRVRAFGKTARFREGEKKTARWRSRERIWCGQEKWREIGDVREKLHAVGVRESGVVV
jgi:hypothetical protein